jgi:hypothetical protein
MFRHGQAISFFLMSSDNGAPRSLVQSTCPSGCICDQPTSWKTEGLVLNHLKHVDIVGLQGAEREVTFVKQLFSCAIVLENIRITFDYQVTGSKIREFRQALAGFSRPETSVEFTCSVMRT